MRNEIEKQMEYVRGLSETEVQNLWINANKPCVCSKGAASFHVDKAVATELLKTQPHFDWRVIDNQVTLLIHG